MWVDVPAFTSRCVYIDGQHVYPGPDCPHKQHVTQDEMGTIPEVGWTVQQS